MDKNIEQTLMNEITVLKTENKNIIHRVKNLEEDKEILHKMEALMEVSVTAQQELVTSVKEINVKQGRFDEQLINFNNTLNKVNENMTNLNSNQQKIQIDLVTLKDDVSDNQEQLKKVEELANENRDKGKFDVTEFLGKKLPEVIGLTIIGALLAYIGLK